MEISYDKDLFYYLYIIKGKHMGKKKKCSHPCDCDKSTKTGKCLKKCPPGKVRNPLTNRCVKKKASKKKSSIYKSAYKDRVSNLTDWFDVVEATEISEPGELDIDTKKKKKPRKVRRLPVSLTEGLVRSSIYDIRKNIRKDKKRKKKNRNPGKVRDMFRPKSVDTMSFFKVKRVEKPWFRVLRDWYHGIDLPVFSQKGEGITWETSVLHSNGSSTFSDTLGSIGEDNADENENHNVGLRRARSRMMLRAVHLDRKTNRNDREKKRIHRHGDPVHARHRHLVHTPSAFQTEEVEGDVFVVPSGPRKGYQSASEYYAASPHTELVQFWRRVVIELKKKMNAGRDVKLVVHDSVTVPMFHVVIRDVMIRN